MKFIAMAAAASALTIDPVNPTGLEPPPPDYPDGYYYPLRAPLIWENTQEANDIKKYYVAGKHEHSLADYVQMDDNMNQKMLSQFIQIDLERRLLPDEQCKFIKAENPRAWPKYVADGLCEESAPEWEPAY